MASIAIAIVFCVLASGILMLRRDVVKYRPGQYVAEDIHARVSFQVRDNRALTNEQHFARLRTPRIYRADSDLWEGLEARLRKLPDQFAGATIDELPSSLVRQFRLEFGAFTTELDGATATALDQCRTAARRPGYDKAVAEFIAALRPLIILPAGQWQDEYKRLRDVDATPRIEIRGVGEVRINDTFSSAPGDELLTHIQNAAQVNFPEQMQRNLVAFTYHAIAAQPPYTLDEEATAARENAAAQAVPPSRGIVSYEKNRIIKREGSITESDWQLLRAEHEAYLADKLAGWQMFKAQSGLVGIVVVVTLALAGYVWYYQRRVIRNHARATGIVVLMLSMLLLAQLAGIGTGPLHLFGIAPTILVAMIMAIAYDRRFAIGVGIMHAILVTVALNQGIGFYLTLFVGVMTCSFLLDEIRSRSKLIEVGGTTALALILATAAAGAMSLDPVEPLGLIARNCMMAGAAGMTVGFVVLGILPFVEKVFRITTSMTLLELADASQPLMRRLAIEAPGTYNHSLQVATLAEEAAEAIGANSLLCRVGAYYHDVGKINKADYFVENQSGGINRHINLSPSVSLLIIIGHVKDGIEMAREYNLPTSLFPFIQQHHGTTLVEYFYHQAMANQQDQPPPRGMGQPAISEQQYRYPGPKPRSREIAIVMLADTVESAARAMGEPTAGRIETLVHELSMKRLLDGQFDECDLTMRDLEHIERSLVKTLLSIYHGRIAYPSASAAANPAPASEVARSAVTSRTA
jgi:putative nucleotidyltransferase with HDIG domain